MKTMPDLTDTSVPPRRMLPRRDSWVIAVTAVALIAGAMFLDRISIPGTPAARPTTEPALPRPAPGQPPPSLATTTQDADWLEVVRSIGAYDSWLRANPDPELVRQYMHPLNPDYAEAVDVTRRLAAGELRYDPPPDAIKVRQVRIMSGDRNTVRLFVILDFPRFRVVDATGRQVHDEPPGPGRSLAWVLRFDEGMWRLARVEPV
jgi:hypothetical protein